MCRSVQLSSSKIGVQLGRCMPDPAPGTTVQDEGGQVLVAVARGARDRGHGGRSLPPPTPPKQPVRPSRPKDQSLAMASPFPHPRQRPAHRCSRNEEVPPFYKLVAACRSPLKRVCNPRGQGAMKSGVPLKSRRSNLQENWPLQHHGRPRWGPPGSCSHALVAAPAKRRRLTGTQVKKSSRVGIVRMLEYGRLSEIWPFAYQISQKSEVSFHVM